jgi:site-specific recombinase XerD
MNLQLLIEQFITYRKSLGECQDVNGRVLRAFGRAMGAGADITNVRIDQVAAFLTGTRPLSCYWGFKYSVVRVFYHYAISHGYVSVVPLPTVIPKQPSPFVPYIYSHEDLRSLLQAIDSDQRRHALLEPVTSHTIVLLLYGTGMRVSEAVHLNCADVDLKGSLLTVRETKFHKSRLVPFGPRLGQVLAQYAARIRKPGEQDAFFTTRAGTRVNLDTLRDNFRRFCTRAGIQRADGSRYQPRLHDIRHTFAVDCLTAWYRQGADVQQLLPQLSCYLGHGSLRATQVYLNMTPELLQEANRRFERYTQKEEDHHV